MNRAPGKRVFLAIGTVLLLAAGSAAALQGPAIVGTVKSETGRAIEDVMVQGCTASYCLVATTDARGRFSIEGLKPPVRVAVKTPQDDSVTPWRAESIVPVHLVGTSTVDVGTVYVPTLPKPVTLRPTDDPQTVSLPDGLSLTLRRGNLKMPLGAAEHDRLTARLIPAKQVPMFADLGSEKVVAVYALYPFAAKSSSKVAVRLKTTLPPGTKVRLRTIHELDGTLSEPQNGRSDGKFVSSDPGEGIVNFTWLIVSR